MRVLIIKTSSLGDVLHTLPALTDAARMIPGIRFDWVVEEGFAEIPAWHPAVDRVLPVAIRRWRKAPLAAWRSGEPQRWRAALRARDYDLCIDAQGLLKSALLTHFTRAPVAGLDRASAREPLASRWYDHGYPVPWQQHAVERVRQLFAQALGYAVPAGVGDYGLARERVLAGAPAPQGDRPRLVLLHGTTWPTKHWPEAHWRQLAELAVAAGFHVRLPWGNDAERQRAGRLADALPQAEVLPRLSLAGIAAVLADAEGAIAVDTGLGHLAAALDVPCLSLFGPTDPRRTAAYGARQQHLAAALECTPCLQERCNRPGAPPPGQAGFPPCLQTLTPERVWRLWCEQVTPA